MKKVIELRGKFVEYREKRVKLNNGMEVVHKFEHPTDLWWKLKEAVKGKKVKITVEEMEGE